jgi:hypothetical protein
MQLVVAVAGAVVGSFIPGVGPALGPALGSVAFGLPLTAADSSDESTSDHEHPVPLRIEDTRIGLR